VKRRLHIILGFRGALLRDTIAPSAREAKIRCVNSLWANYPEYESENILWPDVEKWGWRCVPVTLTWPAPRKVRRR